MSTIGLTTFALYRAPTFRPDTLEGVEVLAGAKEAKLSSTGRLELEIASLPVHSAHCAAHLPREGVLMLYGRQDSMLELQRMRSEARRVNAEFAWADLEVDVGEIATRTVDRSALRAAGQSMRFLSLRRLHSSLKGEVLQQFTDYADSQGDKIDASLSRDAQIASRPDLWDRLYRDDRDFQHIDVLVIPIADIPDAPENLRYVAYVRETVRITSITQGSDHVALRMPSRFKASSM